ncbi:MAG: prolipoprotein diacylglyceryl transferase, partial [Bacteriovorax sp.]|nr:prolipoprotein diacylglyceryl transferase [Bacteriovorax sp.]
AYFTLYSYPLFMGLAWGVGYYLTKYLFEKNHEDSSKLLNLYLGVFLTAWIGAKVFFLLFSAKHKIYQYLYADYFWLGGGFVFYGGLVFGIIFFLLYSIYYKKFNFQNSFLLIPGLIFGHAIGRVGCFLTGCCYGSQCSLPWAVKMEGEFRHPVQLYEAIALFILGYFSLRWIANKKTNLFIITQYLIIYSAVRFVIEFFRGDEVRGVFWLSFSTSQLISIGIFICALIAKKFIQKQQIF